MKQSVYQISLTIRDKKDVSETEELEALRKKAHFSQADVYIMGLRKMATMINKAKNLVKG